MSQDNEYLDFGNDKKFMDPGINENVRLTEFEYESTENYECISCTYTRDDGATIKDKIFNNAPSSIRPFDNESQEDAIKRDRGSRNSKLRSIITNFVTEDQLIKAITAKKPSDFRAAALVYKSLLPANFDSIEGRLLLLYKNNGYLEVPKRVNINKANKVFSVNPADNLEPNVKNKSKLVSPNQTSSKEEEEVADWEA